MDRLSELPEPIQLHILSFLPMRYVVRTVILSKHWRHLWTIVQELYFSTEGFFPYQKFVAFVNRTLLCRGTYKIRKLRIDLYLNSSSREDYDGWISYAAKNNVEDLFLEFNADCYEWLPPQCLYCNSSLKTLRLWSFRFIPDMQISWNSLTKLTLWFSVLRDESIRKIMVGAPKLEYFELFSCWGYNDLTFDSPYLRTVIVCEYQSVDYESDVYPHGPVMRISAPNVCTLRLSGSLYRKCVLMNVSSVVHATLDFRPYIHPFREVNLKWQKDNLMELRRSLKHVESLTMGIWCIEPRGTELADSENFCNANRANYIASQAKHVKCLLHHLKTIKITQFVEQHSVFPFLEFILKNGRVLENLVIIANRELEENSPESLLKVAQRLLSLPRASSRAVVTLLN